MPGIQPNSPKTFDNRKDLLVRIELLENQVRKLTSLLAVKGTASENESATSHSLEVKPDAPLDTKVHTVGEAVEEGLYMRTDGKQAAYFSKARASEVATNAAAFTGNLSGTNTDVQKALETIDAMSVGGTGDVTGPAGAVDNNIATYNGITGKIIKDGGISAASFEVAGAVGTHESTYNHANYDTAYGWGDHAGLYDPVGTAASAVGAHELAYDHDKLHTQNTDTGTTGNTFTVDSDSTTGKIIIDVALGVADKSLTLTNDALTDNRTITFPNNTGTVALTSDIPSSFDNISEGNSKVEVIDAGTGYVSIYIDGAEKYRLDASGIADTSGNEILKFAFNASAVNEIAVANAATTSKPKISTEGGDTDIGLELATKGTGQLDVIVGATQRFYVSATEAGTNSADFNINGVLKIDGTQVLQGQEAAIADIADTSGPAKDGTARAMCNTILALLRTHGLIAT